MSTTATAIQHMLYELHRLESLIDEKVELQLSPDGAWRLLMPNVGYEPGDHHSVLLVGSDFETEFFNAIGELQSRVKEENDIEFELQVARARQFLDELAKLSMEDER